MAAISFFCAYWFSLIIVFLNRKMDSPSSDEELFNLNGLQTQLKSFLEMRNVSDEIITYILSENMDSNTILSMPENELESLFPKYGDRLAVQEFCRRQNTGTSKRKLGLIDKLRKKIALKNNCNIKEKKEKSTPNLKKYRKIELGWLHFSDNENKFIQVRSIKGGGTRHIQLPVTACKQDLLQTAKQLFFPNNKSPKGRSNEFIFGIMDFKESVLDDNISIGEIFKLTGLNRLKFYLTTRKKITNFLQNNHFDFTFIPSSNSSSVQTRSSATLTSTVTSGAYAQDQSLLDTSKDMPLQYPSEFPNQENAINFERVFTNSPIDQDLNSFKPEILTLHRGQVFNELVDIFLNKNIDMYPIYIQMILPNGLPEKAYDDGGVFRDCLTEFWGTFYEQCTVGTTMRIPYLRHDFSTEKWEAIAKVIHKGWVCEKYFPIRIIQPFMECCILGSPETNLSSSFMDFIPMHEAEILKQAQIDFNAVDNEDLIEILSNLESKWKPTEENLKKLINDIAHKDIIQKPKFIIDCWKKVLYNLVTSEELRDIYKNSKPCAKNVIQSFEFPSELNEEKIKAISFLKKYIRECDNNTLGLFLRFCTGSDIIIGKKITISFIKSESLARAPIARTCGCLLELPYSYENYLEFRAEFNSLLRSDIWLMDLP